MCRTLLMACGAALLLTAPLMSVAPAEAEGVPERFTFTVPGFDGRLDLTVHRWSTDAERDRVHTLVERDGADSLLNAFRQSNAAGYINWPGSVIYTLRYAHRTARPDGGEDIILVADQPLWQWWGTSPRVINAPNRAYSVIQLRMDKFGRGEMKASANVTADSAAGVVLANFDNEPALVTDFRRETAKSASATF